jgi:chromosome partitioning protein
MDADFSPGNGAELIIAGKARKGVDKLIQHTDQGDIIPATENLAGEAAIIIDEDDRSVRLKESIRTMKAKYDYIVIDTPPGLSLLTTNALAAAHGCIVPAMVEDAFSLQGIGQLSKTIEAIRGENPSLKIMGILLTHCGTRIRPTSIERIITGMIEQTAKKYKIKVFRSRICKRTALFESNATQKNIFAYDEESKSAIEYNNLVEEIIKEGGK